MNVKRGIFRIWLVAGGGWVAFNLYFCWFMIDSHTNLVLRNTFMPPLAVFIIGSIIYWALSGFARK